MGSKNTILRDSTKGGGRELSRRWRGFDELPTSEGHWTVERGWLRPISR